MAKVKKTLALEIINFKHPQTHETALVSPPPLIPPSLYLALYSKRYPSPYLHVNITQITAQHVVFILCVW